MRMVVGTAKGSPSFVLFVPPRVDAWRETYDDGSKQARLMAVITWNGLAAWLKKER